MKLRRARVALFVAAGAALAVPHGAAPRGKGGLPHVGTVEDVGVDLTLLDVEVTDKDGRPAPGLSMRDFEVRLDGKVWPLYSVDDLCSCASGSPDARSDSSATPAEPTADGAFASSLPSALEGPSDSTRFVLYFDFSRLRMDGRGRGGEGMDSEGPSRGERDDGRGLLFRRGPEGGVSLHEEPREASAGDRGDLRRSQDEGHLGAGAHAPHVRVRDLPGPVLPSRRRESGPVHAAREDGARSGAALLPRVPGFPGRAGSGAGPQVGPLLLRERGHHPQPFLRHRP